MTDNVVHPGEIEFLIQHLNPTKIKDIGTLGWFEEHKRLEKLRQQSVNEAANFCEEYVIYQLLAYNKVLVLLHEVLVIDIWKKKFFRKLTKFMNKDEPNFPFIPYMILYHECAALNFLQIALHQKPSIEALSDNVIDLIDYCALKLADLSANNFKTALDEDSSSKRLFAHADHMTFNNGLAAIAIFSAISNCLEDLSLTSVKQLFTKHDVPVLMTALLEIQPWKRGNKNNHEIYEEGKWKVWDGEQLPKYEAQCWFTLRAMLLYSISSHCYEITEFRRQQILKVQKYMHELLFDQLSPLLDLKQIIMQLAMTEMIYEDSKKSTFLLECIPELRNNLLADREWKKVVSRNLELTFNGSEAEIQMIAKIISETYDNDNDNDIMSEVKKVQPHFSKELPNSCKKCGRSAEKKCSKCHKTYYCSRFCQVKDWNNHKEICI